MRRKRSAASSERGGRRFGKGCLGITGLLVLVIVVGAITAGGGGDDEEPTATTVSQAEQTGGQEPNEEAAEESTEEPTNEGAADSRCEPVDNALVDGISEGLTVEGGSLRNVQAVKSDDFEDVWFVAADIQAAGLEGSDDIGIWATNSLTAGEGLIYSVDEVALEFSDWGDGGQTDAQLRTTDDGAQEARTCAETTA